MLKKTLAVLFAFVVSGCQGAKTYQPLSLNVYGQNKSLLMSTRNNLPTEPVFALFNNAYKMLYEENEAIAKKDPNSPDKYFSRFIESASKTLEVSFFDIDDSGAVSDIISAQKRGVKVRVVTDSDNLRDKENPLKPRKAIEALKSAGIPVKDDQRSAFMHHKFMIADGERVWVSSMNPTGSSMYHHNNNTVIVSSALLAQNYQAEFNRNFGGEFGGKPAQVINPLIEVGGATIKTYFSPRGGTKAAIIEELKKAQKSIRFLAFSFTEKDTGNLMIQKKNEGLKVEGIFDACLIDRYSMYYPFRENKIFVLRDGNQALLHNKTIIIDEETVITGSYNFSKSAEESNNEDVIIIKSPTLAKQFTDEFSRLKTAALSHKDIPAYDHPACNH